MTNEHLDDLPESCQAADWCDGDPEVRVTIEQGAVTMERFYCVIHGRSMPHAEPLTADAEEFFS